jgi:hypothetical protein
MQQGVFEAAPLLSGPAHFPWGGSFLHGTTLAGMTSLNRRFAFRATIKPEYRGRLPGPGAGAAGSVAGSPRHISQTAARQPENADAYVALGSVLAEMGQLRGRSAAAAGAACARPRGQAAIPQQPGDCLTSQNRHAKPQTWSAPRPWRRSAGLDPRTSIPCSAGRFEVCAAVQKLLDRNPNDPQLHRPITACCTGGGKRNSRLL